MYLGPWPQVRHTEEQYCARDEEFKLFMSYISEILSVLILTWGDDRIDVKQTIISNDMMRVILRS